MEYYNLTTPQANIWNLQKYYADTSIANICGAVFYREKRDSTLLQSAIRLFIKNQSGVRLRFVEENEPRQYVSEEIVDDIPIMEFDSMEEFEEYVKKFVKEPIGLTHCSMYRFAVLQIGNKSGILAELSHLISDAWTMGLLVNQFDQAYHKLLHHSDEALVEGDYREYIRSEKEYRESPRYEKDRAYWEKKYIARPEESPIKLKSVSMYHIQAKRITKTLPLSLEQKIAAYCKTNPVSQAVLFEMAVVIYLSKINADNKSITIGVPMLNRSNAKEKKIAGMFISTMPLTITLTENMTVSELAGQISREHIDIFRHQKYPYADILKYLREKQNFSGNLYDVMVSYQNARTDSLSDTVWYSNGYSEVPFILHIDNRDDKESHTINIDYQTAVFQEETEVHCIIERLEYIILQIVENNCGFISDMDIVPENEYEKLIYKFNDTAVAYPKDKCVHELFTEQAQKTPDQTALVFKNQSFTYRQLDEMSNSLAHVLRERGVERNDVVPIIAKRSWHVVVAMLGVLKAGGAYMPVSPDYPVERIGYMLETADAKLVLQYGYEKKLSVEQINLSDFNYADNKEEIENRNLPEDLCYVIFTSGSTGRPKGVEISHRNLVNFMDDNEKNAYQHHAVTNGKVMLASTVFTFDISVFEMYLSLLNGLTIVMADEDEINSPQQTVDLIEKYAIDIIQCTPTKLSLFMNHDMFRKAMGQIKIIMLGAEELTQEICQKAAEYTDACVFNGYGPTEITIGASFKRINNGNAITIGRPIANTQIYILDQNQKTVPIGVAGELCIAGDSVGKGYLNRPELTAERFIPNPFATAGNGHGKTMYRTGDLARFRADGEIEYLGRIDTQVKIRGLRIELGEIESVMGSFTGIQLSAVADKRDENDRQYLVGYYTAGEAVDEKELRKHLSAKLPKYMVPNYFIYLNDMPMTSSGKIDRKNLPMPDFTVNDAVYAAPETEREKLCCRILEEVLEYEQVGVEDDFFEMGGDSLRAIVYTAKLQDKGMNLTLQNVFDYPTVRKLCHFLESGTERKIHYDASAFDRYRGILSFNVIDETFIPKKSGLGNILLTGATGFLGAHVLDRLMKEEEGKIYCLVRESNEESCLERIKKILQYYFGDKYELELGKRIIPIEGDMEREGLSEEIPPYVETVIHTAATVKHYGSYEYFYRVNVEGTRHVVDYARSAGARMIHISTLSVSGNSMLDDFSVYHSEKEKYFDETSFFIEQPMDNVYIHSKFEAEKVVFDAMLDGLDAKIIRVGNLTNRMIDFKFQPNYTQNAFLTRVKAILEFGLLPDYLMPLYTEFSPVDLTAEGIVKIAQYADRQNVFHLNSNRPIYYDRLLEILSRLEIPMEVLDGKTFYKALRQTMKDMGTEYIYEALQNDMDEEGRLVYDSNIHIENDFTVWFLKLVGFEWNETDFEYIRGYIEYFRRIGFLKV